MWVLVQIKSNRPLIIACLYHPPAADQSTTSDYIESTIAKLTPKHPNANFVLTGDFNRLPVDNLCAQFGLRDLVNFPTRDQAKLDLMLTDVDEYDHPIKLAPISHNDHCCILLEGKQFHRSNYTKVRRRLVTPERKNSLLSDLASESWENVLNTDSIHDKVTNLNSTVTQLLNKHCPERDIKIRADRPQWMTSSILKLIKARDEAYDRGCSSYKFIRSLVQKAIRSSKRRFIDEKLNSEQNTKEWWQTVKQITNGKSSKPIPDYMVIEGDRVSSKQLGENLNIYYKSVGGEAVETTNSSSSSIPSSRVPLDLLSLGEVKQLLRKLDTSKSTSCEDFPTWVSKEGMEDMCVPVQDIINSMLVTKQYPDFWKRAQITPLPKNSCPTMHKDFRPVSLLHHLGKVCEQVIVDKLKFCVKQLIGSDQYAYRPSVGTLDAILQLIDDITSDLDLAHNNYVQLGCVDFSKAFDRLQPSVVLSKMKNYGVNENILDILADFLVRRKQCVKLNGTFSDYIDISVGAPQGTKLGPLLWLFYVNDLNVDDFKVVKYADDTTFYKPFGKNSTDSIAPAILRTQQWADENNMLLNADKTVIMNILLNYHNEYNDPVILGNEVSISPSHTAKFLGITLDNHLSFSKHVESLVSSCNSRLFLLRQLKVLGMNENGLKNFYLANIRSILTYASPAWFSLLSDGDKSSLERIQRSATRTIFPDHSYEDRLTLLNIPTLSDFIFDLSKRHFNKIASDPEHPLFSRVIRNTGRTSSRLNTIFRPKICKTQKRAKSFFPIMMSHFNTIQP